MYQPTLRADRTKGPADLLGIEDAPGWMKDPARACSPERAANPGLWTSEKRRDLYAAAEICRAECPFLERCGERAIEKNERYHVWGGYVRSSRKARLKQAAACRVLESTEAPA